MGALAAAVEEGHADPGQLARYRHDGTRSAAGGPGKAAPRRARGAPYPSPWWARKAASASAPM